MRYEFVLATVGMILLGSFMQAVSAEVRVHVGYLNNLTGQPPASVTPTPFDSNARTTLISSGGVTDPHDTGVIRFKNFSGAPVTIDLVRVVTEGEGPVEDCAANVFKIWDASLPFTLDPHKNLVLAETANFNFDSSNCGLGLDPVVIFKLNDGPQFTCVDTGRVLLGGEEAGNTPETTPYQLIPCVQSAGGPP